MDPRVQQTVSYAEKWQHIEFVKSWVDEIYVNRAFHSFSLHTLELTEKFNASYTLFKENNSIKDFQELVTIATDLEKKLLQEGTEGTL